MIYAQFFDKAVTSDELIPACGDRSVVVIDGRMGSVTKDDIAKTTCKRRGYLAYQLCRGSSFTQSTPIGGIIRI